MNDAEERVHGSLVFSDVCGVKAAKSGVVFSLERIYVLRHGMDLESLISEKAADKKSAQSKKK